MAVSKRRGVAFVLVGAVVGTLLWLGMVLLTEGSLNAVGVVVTVGMIVVVTALVLWYELKIDWPKKKDRRWGE